MKHTISFFLSFLLYGTLIAHEATPTHQNQISAKKRLPSNRIKVLIYELTEKTKPLILNNGHFRVYSDHTLLCKTEQPLSIAYKNNTIWINNKPVPHPHIHIHSHNNIIGVHHQKFQGSLHLIKNERRLLVINHVDLEEYVYAVLKTESWPGWPIEVNKVFAIVSRSYALAMIGQSRTQKLPYHIKNTNAHQTYHGIHENSTLRHAVTQTKDMYLIHDNKPILAMFDSCCGGIIPAHITEFNFKKAPYLARPYACNHCKKCRIYRWHHTIPLSDISKRITTLLEKQIFISNLHIVKKDKAGLVQTIKAEQGKEHHLLSGQQFYSALKEVKSFCYDIHRKKDHLLISGKGFGHHIGLCQWGAREMVRDGWHYKRILNFYYPGTNLMQMKQW